MEQITLLIRQFGRALDLLEEQIRALPEEGLRGGEVEMLVPSRVEVRATD